MIPGCGDARRRHRQALEERGRIEIERGVHRSGCGLQPDHSGRRLLEGHLLLVGGVGGVVGGYGVDGAVGECRP